MALSGSTSRTAQPTDDTQTLDLSRYSIDPDAPVPIYHQIKGNIRALIEDGHLRPGQALPPERVLAAAYGANRLTLRQAVGELVHEGVLRRQRGVGTFVAEPKLSLDMVGAAGFSDLIAAAGRGRSTRLISPRDRACARSRRAPPRARGERPGLATPAPAVRGRRALPDRDGLPALRAVPEPRRGRLRPRVPVRNAEAAGRLCARRVRGRPRAGHPRRVRARAATTRERARLDSSSRLRRGTPTAWCSSTARRSCVAIARATSSTRAR